MQALREQNTTARPKSPAAVVVAGGEAQTVSSTDERESPVCTTTQSTTSPDATVTQSNPQNEA